MQSHQLPVAWSQDPSLSECALVAHTSASSRVAAASRVVQFGCVYQALRPSRRRLQFIFRRRHLDHGFVPSPRLCKTRTTPC